MKSEVPRTQIKFSNSLLKFRSTEGTPSGVIQPISSIKGILKNDGNRLLSVEKEQDQPPLKKLKVDELSQRFSKPGSVQAVKPIPGLVSKPPTPSSNGTTANQPGPILACSLCSFRYQDLFLKIVCQSKYPRWQMFWQLTLSLPGRQPTFSSWTMWWRCTIRWEATGSQTCWESSSAGCRRNKSKWKFTSM